MDKLPDRLRALREQRGLTQQEVADAIGIDRSTLAGYESGRSRPEHKHLLGLGRYFGVSLDYLIGRTEVLEPAPPEDQEIHIIRRSMTGLSEAERQDILDYIKWRNEQSRRKGRAGDGAESPAGPERGPQHRSSEDAL